MVYEQLIRNWSEIATHLSKPKNDQDLDRLIELSDYLMDNMSEKLEGLLDYVGLLIEEYESKNIPEPEGDPIEALQLLMKEHGLRQKDLVEIGSPGVISEVLNRKRELNKRQIIALSERFHCSPAVFL